MRAGLRREDAGASAEYALLLAPLALALIAAIVFLRTNIVDSFFRGGQSTVAYRTSTAQVCDPSYSGACVPPYPLDVDCSDLRALGIDEVTVTRSDPHDLDPDGDGIGCD